MLRKIYLNTMKSKIKKKISEVNVNFVFVIFFFYFYGIKNIKRLSGKISYLCALLTTGI
jgi:hypothetical protein